MSINFPNIDRYIIKFSDKIGVTWYSLSYVAGILIGWKYALYLIKKTHAKISEKDLDDFVTYAIIAIIIGGRLGYVFLYDPVRYLSNPIEILKTYEGGMSFHGGLLGLIITCYFFCKYKNIRFLEFSDILVQAAPIGLGLGRIANFINAELYGSVTNMPWGVIFPYAGTLPRHPSQIYEALTEGLLLLLILAYFSHAKDLYKQEGRITGLFLILYATARSFCELFRIPDFVFLSLTSGQIYSIPMIFFGLFLLIRKTAHNDRK
ncbi:MAG: prolipoprotein diacylglyceryl transferase [Rickettsiaceae bacterium]|nr:prolipoprotein diacylglyceryl transferase [Rickettsiaceae bacterium]